MKNLLRSSPALLLTLLATVLPASALINFTVTATADDTPGTAAENYTAGQAYTFVYTLTPDFPANRFYFPGQNNAWFEKGIKDDVSLFTAVDGSGVAGTYTDPAAPTGSPFSFARADSGNFLGLFAGAEAGNIGLTTLAGSPLTHVIASMNLDIPFFEALSHYTNPADYFATHLGDYRAWGGTVGLYGNTIDGATFRVTDVSISSSESGRNISAIPEPSTYAALLGLGTLGLALWHRRKIGPSSGRIGRNEAPTPPN